MYSELSTHTAEESVRLQLMNTLTWRNQNQSPLLSLQAARLVGVTLGV